jgi:polyhydroxyalkanoate synthase
VPWQAAYGSTGVLSGSKDKTFVLGASGHIAGVINPANKNKRSHWTNAKLPAKADDWFKTATETPGSWWPVWSEWLGHHAGKMVAAPKAYGNRSHKAIEPAPGRYVKQKA